MMLPGSTGMPARLRVSGRTRRSGGRIRSVSAGAAPSRRS
jgi:hypothetical protein